MLLGASDESEVSRYERFIRRPPLATAFMCEQLLGVPLPDLFAGMYDDAWETLQYRARLLLEELEKQADPLSARKRQFLDRLLFANLSHSKK